MAGFKPDFRLRFFQRRSVNAAEDRILEPPAGSSHTDPFLIATVQHTGTVNIGGLQVTRTYRPYFASVQGKRGGIDLLTKRLQTGSVRVGLLDVKTLSGDNAKRWATAFVGDGKGVDPLLSSRVEIDIITDPTLDRNTDANWSRFWVGRIYRGDLQNLLDLFLDVRDLAEDMNFQIFVQEPHSSITYAHRPPIFPTGGLLKDYGQHKALALPQATFKAGLQAKQGDLVINVSQTEQLYGRAGRLLHSGWPNLFGGIDVIAVVGSRNVRVHTRILSGGGARNGEEAEYFAWDTLHAVTGTPRHAYLGVVGIAEMTKPDGSLDTDDPLAKTLPPVDAVVELYIYVKPSAGTRSFLPPNLELIFDRAPGFDPDIIRYDDPLLVSDRHPADFLADLLDGKFGILKKDGSVFWSIPRDTASFSALAADATIRKGRWIVRGAAALNEWAETQILSPWQIAWYLNAEGKVVLVDLRRPTKAKVDAAPTLTDEDFDILESQGWEPTAEEAITAVHFTYMAETRLQPKELIDDTEVTPKVGPGRFVERDIPLMDPLEDPAAVSDFGDRPHHVMALGFRVELDEQTTPGDPRRQAIESDIRSLKEGFRAPFMRGTHFARATGRRASSTILGLAPGSLVKLATSFLPNPATGQRGGTRVMRVSEIWDDDLLRPMRLIDLGPNQQAGAPSIGTLAQETGNTKHGIVIPITPATANDRIEVAIARTSTGVGTQPTEGSELWQTKVIERFPSGATNVTIRELPANSRYWVRARALAEDLEGHLLPSAWVFPTVQSVDTAGYTAPSGLAAGSITATTALLTWANGESALLVEVLLALDGQTLQRVVILPPGSTRYDLKRLVASTAYDADVRHLDPAGGVTGTSHVDFTTTASAPTAPNVKRIRVVV